MAKHAVGIVMLDLAWCGGLSEAKKIATMAEAHQLPVAPHDCTGPIVFTASCHLSLNAPNALIQESVRAFYTGWYKELVTELPRMEKGHILPMQGPGLGTELLPDVKKRADAVVQTSSIESVMPPSAMMVWPVIMAPPASRKRTTSAMSSGLARRLRTAVSSAKRLRASGQASVQGVWVWPGAPR